MNQPNSKCRMYIRPEIKTLQLELQTVLAASNDPIISNPSMGWETKEHPSITNPSFPWNSQKIDSSLW